MDVSIVIVNWHSALDLRRALESVLARKGPLSSEILVIDSGSFDGCAALIATEFPQVSFLQAATNVGFARANNLASAAASGDALLFLNPDTQVLDDALDELFQQLMCDPRAAIAGPVLLNGDGTLQTTCVRSFPTLLNQTLDSHCLQTVFPRAWLWGRQALPEATRASVRVEAVSGACLMIKRSIFEQVGGFSTEYFMYAEDMDLCLKCARAGYGTLHVPGARVVHYGGASSAKADVSTFAAVVAVESQWRFFLKMHSRAHAAAYRACVLLAASIRLAALLAMWMVRRLAGHGGQRPLALEKWRARLAWALGGQAWARALGRDTVRART
jgi:GT2 family glycosyltransferase